MKNIQLNNAEIWNAIYEAGHKMNYPDDGFVRLFSQLVKYKIPKAAKILDFGFGSGATTMYLLRNEYEVCGLEISKSAIQLASNILSKMEMSASLVHYDGLDFPFESESFDAVVAWQVLSYNNEKTMREKLLEINRVLKPGGVFLSAFSMPGSSLDLISTPLKDGLGTRLIDKGNQRGAAICIPNRQKLDELFLGLNARIGSLVYDLSEFELEPNSCWIVTFEKNIEN